MTRSPSRTTPLPPPLPLPAQPTAATGAFVVLLVLTLGLLPTGPAAAQIPETFDNLRVLPEDVPRGELIETMRGFSFGLGVRCHHCHVGEEGQPMSEWDFASDRKATKRTAREMMRMVREINRDLRARLAAVEGRPAPSVEITCVTCHHGLPEPRTLEGLLARVVAEDGAGAAVERYRQLRREHHGRGRYDFGEWTLLRLAEELGRQASGEGMSSDGTPEGLIPILELNAEVFPDSAATRMALGRAHLAAGDRQAARRQIERARDLGHPRAAEMLRALAAREGGARDEATEGRP